MSKVTESDLSVALHRWREVVGTDWVKMDTESLAAAAQATFKTTNTPIAIIAPESVQQVAECLRIATAGKIPLYPVSRGRNWGYGSRVAHVDRSVILDLSRLNRIRDFSEDLGYITVEPGVTQDQVVAYLRERGSKRVLNHPGSLGSISLLGNLLDRGFAVFSASPYENRAQAFCNLEAVTARGEIFKTGVGRFGEMSVAALDDWGIGPQLNGMLLQSNLAVVTSGTLWLASRSEYPQHFLVSVDAADLPLLMDSLRTIRHEVDPRTRFFAMNRYRYAAHFGQYPWKLTGGRTPLEPEEIKAITPQLKGDWTCVGILHCASRLQRLANVKLVKKTLGPLKRQTNFINADTAAWIRRFWWPISVLSGTDPRLYVDRLYDGRRVRDYDSMVSLNQLYWRMRERPGPDADPDKDCGLYFYFPMVPWDGKRIREIVDVCAKVMLSTGFEPNIALRFPTDRCVLVACGIGFDRKIEAEDDKARACYEALVTTIAAMGCLPYRPGIQGMDLLPMPVDASSVILKRLKHALDPSDIIAPGRYDDRKNWQEVD